MFITLIILYFPETAGRPNPGTHSRLLSSLFTMGGNSVELQRRMVYDFFRGIDPGIHKLLYSIKILAPHVHRAPPRLLMCRPPRHGPLQGSSYRAPAVPSSPRVSRPVPRAPGERGRTRGVGGGTGRGIPSGGEQEC